MACHQMFSQLAAPFTRFFRPSQTFARTGFRLAAGTAAIGCFIIDVFTDANIDIAVLYVVVVLLSERFADDRGIRTVGGCCVALTVLGWLLSPGNRFGPVAIANVSLSILAITASTALLLQARRAKQSLQRAQEELARVNRVATLGELTAAMAHEINQPLTGLVSSAGACARWLTGDPPNLAAARQSVTRIIADGKRAADVVTRIRSLVSGAPPQKERMNVNDCIRGVIGLLEPEIRRNHIVVQTHLPGDLPLVMADRVGVQQVMLNLIINAIEAIGATEDTLRELLVSSKYAAGEGVVVSVQDSGPGLDNATASRLFDVFYTTKPRGMGMGLAISRTIVEAHGGRIWAAQGASRGATICFAIPCDALSVG